MRRELERGLPAVLRASLAGLVLLVGLPHFVGAVRAQSCMLVGDTAQVSVTSGGVQTLSLTRGAGQNEDFWLMLGSMSGTTPSVYYFANVGLDLASDPYFLRTFHGTSPFLRGGLQGAQGGIFGLFDSAGQATIQVAVPPGTYSFLVGHTIHHGFYMLDQQTLIPKCGSNTVSVTLVP